MKRASADTQHPAQRAPPQLRQSLWSVLTTKSAWADGAMGPSGRLAVNMVWFSGRPSEESVAEIIGGYHGHYNNRYGGPTG